MVGSDDSFQHFLLGWSTFVNFSGAESLHFDIQVEEENQEFEKLKNVEDDVCHGKNKIAQTQNFQLETLVISLWNDHIRHISRKPSTH